MDINDLAYKMMGVVPAIATTGVLTMMSLAKIKQDYESKKTRDVQRYQREFDDPKKYKNNTWLREERKRINQKIGFLKYTPLKDVQVVSPSYNLIVQKLNQINKYVDKLDNDSINIELAESLIDELKFTVLLKHFEFQEDPAFDIERALHIGRFCGRNTQVFKNMEWESSADFAVSMKLDRICRMHDVEYSKSQTPQEVIQADKNMLNRIIDTYTVKGSGKIYEKGFTNFILDLIGSIQEDPIGSLGRAVGYTFATVYNLEQIPRIIKYLAGIRNEPIMANIRGFISNQERIYALIAFGAIGLKTLHDMIVENKDIYGYTEEHRFKINEIEHIIADLENLQNIRLSSKGYDTLNFETILSPEEKLDDLNEYLNQQIDTIEQNNTVVQEPLNESEGEEGEEGEQPVVESENNVDELEPEGIEPIFEQDVNY